MSKNNSGNEIPTIAEIIRENSNDAFEKLLQAVRVHHPGYTRGKLMRMLAYVGKRDKLKWLRRDLDLIQKGKLTVAAQAGPVPKKPPASEPGADLSKEVEQLKAQFLEAVRILWGGLALLEILNNKLASFQLDDEESKKFNGTVQ